MRINLHPDSFSSLDFMALHGCQLQITLGKYQSSLGRHASDSQRLLLDLEFLSLAPHCIELYRAANKIALVGTLENIQNLKRRQLPSRIYNATLANIQFQQLWRGGPPGRTRGGQATLAIEQINASVERWLADDYRASNLEFEIQLSEVAQADITGSQGKNIRQATARLETLLLTRLPPQYLLWQTNRSKYFARLAQPPKLD